MSQPISGDETSSFAAQYRAALENARHLVDGIVVWRVYELPPSPYDRRRGPSLVFEQDGAMHRVRDFPSDWRSLDDHELLALREHA